MWRYLAGGAAALAMAGAGVLVLGSHHSPAPLLAAEPLPPNLPPRAQADAPLPDAAPEAAPATREEKRFNRYDKDRDGKITRDEYLMQRRKAFAKLDTDHDGRLSFEEWAIKATTKFAAADRDGSGAMTPGEFASTAVKRKASARAKCPPTTTAPRAGEDES